MPIYQHDCEKCVYLGTVEVPPPSVFANGPCDAYFCEDAMRTCLIRFGDEGPQYTSCSVLLTFPDGGPYETDPRLFQAREMAVGRGFVEPWERGTVAEREAAKAELTGVSG